MKTKYWPVSFILLLSSLLVAADDNRSRSKIMTLLIQVNDAQNKVLMKESSQEDIEHLFSLYSDDFTYVHEVYGGTYSRQNLYDNTVKFWKQGNYSFTEPRYQIVKTIEGDNAIAVERRQFDGETHMAVFEFKDDKVIRIIEYWQ